MKLIRWDNVGVGQANRQTHQYHDWDRPKSRAEWKCVMKTYLLMNGNIISNICLTLAWFFFTLPIFYLFYLWVRVKCRWWLDWWFYQWNLFGQFKCSYELENKRFTNECSFSPPPSPPPAISLINSLVLIAPVKDQTQEWLSKLSNVFLHTPEIEFIEFKIQKICLKKSNFVKIGPSVFHFTSLQWPPKLLFMTASNLHCT